jgi:hypothetical protein
MTATTPVYSRPRDLWLFELWREPGSIYSGSFLVSIHIINVNDDLINSPYGYYILLEFSSLSGFPFRPGLNRARRPSSMISTQKPGDEETIES